MRRAWRAAWGFACLALLLLSYSAAQKTDEPRSPGRRLAQALAGAPSLAEPLGPFDGDEETLEKYQEQHKDWPGTGLWRSGPLARLLKRRLDVWTWDSRNIAGVCLCIVISLLSSVDRECGASMFLVLFSVLLEFSLRQAIALTAFCTFLGSLGPGIAATNEAVATERGPMAAADYGSAILLLPGLYYGISFGVIVNAILPSWLLGLLIVLVLIISNAELAGSIVSMGLAKREIIKLAQDIKTEAQALAVAASGEGAAMIGGEASVRSGSVATSPDPSVGAPLASAQSVSTGAPPNASAAAASLEPARSSGSAALGTRRLLGSILQRSAAGGAAGAVAASGESVSLTPAPAAVRRENLLRLRTRVRALHARAVRIEAGALLFPAFHFPTHEEIAIAAKSDVETIFGEDHALCAADGHQYLSYSSDPSHSAHRPAAAAGSSPAAAGGGSSGAIAAKPTDDPAAGPDCAWEGFRSGGNPVPPPPMPAGHCGGLRQWFSMQPGFEWALVGKIVVLHLLTEFVRHVRAKPCTRRFWFMLGVMSTLVTILLMAVSASFTIRRLWRGPKWVQGLAEVRRAHRRARHSDDPEMPPLSPVPGSPAPAGPGPAAAALSPRRRGAGTGAAAGAGSPGSPDPAEAGAAAVAALHRIAKAGGSPAGAARGARRGCGCGGLKAWWLNHSPFLRGPASDAITCVNACVSDDGWAHWTVWRVILTEIIAFPMAVLACTLGFTGGTMMSWLMLGLHVRPHVVAATSRFLVMCFTLGTFIAYIISGNLRMTYALGYGAINLIVAPLGMALFRRAALPSRVILTMSLAMGLAALGAFVGAEWAPALKHLDMMIDGVAHKRPLEDGFNLNRFCHGHQLLRGPTGP